ncbi:hypothetical protein B0T11DRAFT_251918 [Plectosphaerella cucumerina]|uniref:HOOK N-terminal domain-containing protein n=1 Tax=Plectosphaerella cucumerina TaxID=40658 RepID=A0A8K0TIA2_9PEZI|nr:hypothetical protein B0T11DRAFT_251918 [Plectosphaerella cucumerina]
MPFSQGAQDALVQWANTFSSDRKAESTEDLHDGVILSYILSDLDATYDPSEIDTQDDRWLTYKKNLQSIYKGIVRLVNRDVPELNRQARISDFRAIASDPDAQGISKVSYPDRILLIQQTRRLTRHVGQILSVLFAVAMLGSNNERFVTRITKDITDSTVLSQLQRITLEMKTLMDEAAAEDDVDRDIANNNRDPDLALEEENAELHAELDKTKKRLADATTRLENLKVSYDDLTDETTKVHEELEAFRTAQDGTSDQVIRSLEARLREQDELILRHENQAEDDREARTRLTAENKALKVKADLADQHGDEANELRFKVEELTRKANMAERYKQKLGAQSDLQKEMENLIYEKQQLQQDLVDFEKLLKRNKALEDTNEQYAKRMHDYEVNFIEMDSQRRAAQAEMAHLKDLIKTQEAQSQADERFITELQEQLNAGGHNSGRNRTPDNETSTGFNLEEELENSKEVAPNLSVELSRLKAENNLLRNSVGSTPENARLRLELEEERTQRKRLQGDYNLCFEKQKVAERDFGELIKAMGGKEYYHSNEILANLKVNLEKVNREVEAERAISRELRERLADQDRELLSAQTDLSAVEKGSVDALEELKQTDQLISASLRDELDAARIEVKNAHIKNEENQSALVKALLEKDEMRKELDTHKEHGSGEAGPEAAKNAEKIKQLRTRLSERNEVSSNVLTPPPTPDYPRRGRRPSSTYTREHIEVIPRSKHLPKDPRYAPMFVDVVAAPLALPKSAIINDSWAGAEPEAVPLGDMGESLVPAPWPRQTSIRPRSKSRTKATKSTKGFARAGAFFSSIFQRA